MKVKSFEVPLYKVDVTLVQVHNSKDLNAVLDICEENGVSDTTYIEEGIKNGAVNGGDTWRNLEKRKMLCIFYPFTDLREQHNIYNHEKRHVEDRILEYFSVDDIESAALLAGFLGEMFYEFSN